MCINRFKHVLNRYNNPIKRDEYFSELELDYAMKSINIEEDKFTNFVKTDQNEQYKFLKELYCEYKKGINILDKFEAYDIELYSKNTERLSNILTYNNNEKFNGIRTSNVLKYHFIGDNKKFKLYIEKQGSKLIVRLIDLFHLAIPSGHKGIPAEIMKERLYNQHKNNKISINLIKHIIKEQ